MSVNQYISVVTDIDENWLVVFEHTINHLYFDYIRLPQLENYFSLFLFFLFLPLLSTFIPLNALYAKFE